MNSFLTNMNSTEKFISVFFSLIISLVLVPSILGKLTMTLPLFLILFIALFLVIIYTITFVFNIKIIPKYKDISPLKIILYSTPITLSSLFYLVAFYPGFMTNDFFNQWQQIHTNHYVDWHPVPHTLIMKAISKLWDVPEAIALSQIVIFALSVGYVLYALERFGFSSKILLIISVLFALNPANSASSIFISKDLIYNSSLMLITIYLANIFITNGKWFMPTINKACFIIVCSTFILFRHNGFLVFLCASILCLIIFYKNILRILAIIIPVLAIYILVKGPIYSFLKVEPGSSNEAFAIPTQQIAAVVKNNGIITESQKKYINNIMTLDEIKANYHPYSVDLLKFHQNFHKEYIEKDTSIFLKLWWEVIKQNPLPAIEAFAKQTSVVWQINEPRDEKGYTFTVNRQVVKNTWGVNNKIFNNNITYIGNKALDISETKSNIWFFWRPALSFFLILIFSFGALLKNGSSVLILVAPVVLNTLSILVAIPAQDFRYVYSNCLTAIIIIPCSLFKLNKLKV
ncbi:hypothetical protein CPJCM30710_15860 [Clostridium polyendosporum]|uniref:Uncharacterized protein n=1 Tax=Clostridium polyendosporum TaxID=69208 RepID=A0A919VFZ3_9CLOT|nr:DUF6020 family protein [Clostridium polyendosporum]GIM28920.1 hypothetical protein CPJCM30710_15860 [Clostridium polyendosporum]